MDPQGSPSKQQYFAQTNQTVSSSMTGTSAVQSKGVTYHQKSISEANEKIANTSKVSSVQNQTTSRPSTSTRKQPQPSGKTHHKAHSSKKKTAESAIKQASTLSAILGSPRGGIPTAASFLGRHQKPDNNSERKVSTTSMKEKLRLKNPTKEVLSHHQK